MILCHFYDFATVDNEPVASCLKTDAPQLPGDQILKKWRLNVKEFIQSNCSAAPVIRLTNFSYSFMLATFIALAGAIGSLLLNKSEKNV